MEDKYKRATHWLPFEHYERHVVLEEEIYPDVETRICLDISVQPQKKFVPKDKEEEISWYPIDVVEAPNPAELPSLQEVALEK